MKILNSIFFLASQGDIFTGGFSITKAGVSIIGIIRSLGAGAVKLIYCAIAGLYEVFMLVAKANLLTSDDIKPLYQRFTVILSIVMIFYVTFEFVKFVVQPEGINDKQQGVDKIIMRMVLVVVMIAFVPNIFSMAYELQNRIIESNVISKLLIGNNQTVDSRKQGYDFSANILSMYYKPACGNDIDNCPSKSEIRQVQNTITNNLNKIRSTGTAQLSEKIDWFIYYNDSWEPLISLNFLFAILVGIFIGCILILYVIDVGTRWAQLLFLQIIAPIPIISYIAPKKDGMFNKWLKQCTTTYIDLFIRIFIINFILLISNILFSKFNGNQLFGNTDASGFAKMLAEIAIILGLLVFANKAPKLLQELLPGGGASSTGFGLKGSDRVAPLAARTIGAGLGGLTGLAKRGVRGTERYMRRSKEVKEALEAQGKSSDYLSRRKYLKDARKAVKAAKKHEKTRKDELTEATRENTKLNNQAKEHENNARKMGYDLVQRGNEKYDNLESAKEIYKKHATKENKDRLDAAQKAYDTEVLNKGLEHLKDTEAGKKYSEVQKKLAGTDKGSNAHVTAAKNNYQAEKNATELEKSQLADEKNKYVGNVLTEGMKITSSALGGTVTGIKVGGSATKLGDISKKVGEASNQVLSQEDKIDKYLENNGSAIPKNVVEVMGDKLKKSFGIPQEAQKIKAEGAKIETEIKRNETDINMASSTKKALDSSKERVESKTQSGESKVTVSSDKEELIKQMQSMGVNETSIGNMKSSITEGKINNVSDIYRNVSAEVQSAKTRATASQEYVTRLENESREFRAQKSASESVKSSINSQIDTIRNTSLASSNQEIANYNNQISQLETERKATGADVSAIDQKINQIQQQKAIAMQSQQNSINKIEQLEEEKRKIDREIIEKESKLETLESAKREADELSRKAIEQEEYAKKVLKGIQKFAIGKALKAFGGDSSDIGDPVLMDNISTMAQEIENLRNTPRMLEIVIRDILADPNLDSDRLIRLLREGDITQFEFDDYDAIQNILNAHASELKNINSKLQQQKNVINNSSATAAANADFEANGGNGKK